MTLSVYARHLVPVAVAFSLAAVAIHHPASAAPPTDKVLLAPHRAVYDLKLAKSQSSRGVQGVRGRILYDFTGNACDGYELQFRQVSELDSGEGKTALSDLRSTTWEDGGAKKFRFNSENKVDSERTDVVNGRAERGAATVAINLSKPKDKALSVPVGSVFPTEHMRRIIVAAREGKTILEFPVYDGSETGEKLYNTLTIIGRPIAPAISHRRTPRPRFLRWQSLRAGRSPSAISKSRKRKTSAAASRRRSIRSRSNSMKTASRAR